MMDRAHPAYDLEYIKAPDSCNRIPWAKLSRARAGTPKTLLQKIESPSNGQRSRSKHDGIESLEKMLAKNSAHIDGSGG